MLSINNAVMQIIVENATTYAERNRIYSLMESEVSSVNNSMITNLYKSALDKAHVNFEDIPDSKGDLTKYHGYDSMVSTLGLMRDLAGRSNTKIPELEIIETAISNIIAYREQFQKGFQLDKEFIILEYNTLVYACVESTSTVIASYVDYIKRPDRVEFTIIKNPKLGGTLCIDNLSRFNQCVKQGDFAKVMSTIIGAGKESFVGVDDIIIPTIIIGGVVMLVPTIRELIFFFYYSRMRISDYLKQQSTFLEINKNNIQSNGAIPAKQKNEILKKQQESINMLNTISDKIKVNHTTSEAKTIQDIKQENKGWTLDSVQSQSASTDQTGFKLL